MRPKQLFREPEQEWQLQPEQQLERVHEDEWAKIIEYVPSFDAGPLLYLTRYTKTESPLRSDKATPGPTPFRRNSYLLALLNMLMADRAAFIVKQQWLMSWLICGFITWECLVRPHTLWVIDSKDDDTLGQVLEYCRTLCRQQEDWISRKNPLVRDSRYELKWDNGFRVFVTPNAINAGPQHLAGHFMDETFASAGQDPLPDFLSINKKIICFDKAEPGWFAYQCELQAGAARI